MENTRQRNTHKSSSRSTSPTRPVPYRTHHHHHQPLLSSRWQQLVVGAGSAAGTTAAVISEESMKCLKYCLSWLQYAIQHIEQQMMILKNYLVSLATNNNNNLLAPTTNTTNNNKTNNQRSVLSGIKKDMVETLRKVVEVITRYAGASLPTQARQTVRGFILNLPGKWATLNDIRSTNTSPACSPMLGPRKLNQVVDPKQEEATLKLLAFGQESVEMLHSVSTVFSDTVDRAELWIDRLKMVPGMSNNKSAAVNETVDLLTLNGESVRLPPIRNLENNQSPQKLNPDL
ncbi:transcription factor Opi1-domain-containing protein [Pilaira anomala]|nr:transcription factor Opi1-domain-containing protein [Pilaira anomala]